MQFLIDTQADSAATLRRIAALLVAEADAQPANPLAASLTPAGTLREPLQLSPPAEVMKADASHASGAGGEDPAAVFGGAQQHVNNSPPPPPPPPAPLNSDAASSSAPPPPAAPPADAPKLDKQGIPWDARIHSETKGLNKSDGNWRNKRGVDKALLETVTAELKAQYAQAASSPGNVTPAAPPPPAGEQMNLQVPPPAAPPPPSVSLPPGNGGMGAPPAPPPPTAAPGAGQVGLDFRTLMQRIVAAKKTPDEVRAAAAAQGLDGIQAAIGAPDKLPAIAAALGV